MYVIIQLFQYKYPLCWCAVVWVSQMAESRSSAHFSGSLWLSLFGCRVSFSPLSLSTSLPPTPLTSILTSISTSTSPHLISSRHLTSSHRTSSPPDRESAPPSSPPSISALICISSQRALRERKGQASSSRFSFLTASTLVLLRRRCLYYHLRRCSLSHRLSSFFSCLI